MLEKQNQMQLSASLLGGAEGTGHNVRIIDSAQPARQIFKPKKKLNIALGFLFGLFLGVGFAVLMEYIDNTLKTPEDVRNVLGLAVLGMIPAQDASGREQRQRKKKEKDDARTAAAAGTPARDVDPALITLQSPLSPIAEAYRELRTAVLLATPGHPPRDLTVTSCQPSEGKTTTAVNLAIALAQLGRRILVVDTDLRRPRCHQVLRTSATRGVSTYLTGNSDLKTLVLPTSAERVWLLPAGPIPPNPAELLDAERFRELLLELRASGDWDHVIFDSPPVLSVVDPLLIGRHTEGTVLVIKSAFTSRESGRLGKEKLLSGRVNLLGVLLNAVATEHVPYQYRYYRYGYSRKEGEPAAEPSPETAQTGGAGSARRA
jgi:capsular exopolysaccharide synthesis family protein